MGRRDRKRREQLDVHVGLPRSVLRMLDQPIAAKQVGKAHPVERPARTGAAAGAGDARPERGVRPARTLGVAQGGIGVRQEQVADRGRLRRLEIRVVGGERSAGGARVADERRGLVDERVVQLAHRAPGGQAKRDAEGLAARPARAQPAGRRPADAPLELRLARVERVAERRIPRELVTGDRVQLEQPAQERSSVVTGQVTALDQRDGVRQIGEREPVREPRPMRALGGVRRRHQLAGRAAPQPSAAAKLLGRLRHRAEPRELGGAPFRLGRLGTAGPRRSTRRRRGALHAAVAFGPLGGPGARGGAGLPTWHDRRLSPRRRILGRHCRPRPAGVCSRRRHLVPDQAQGLGGRGQIRRQDSAAAGGDDRGPCARMEPCTAPKPTRRHLGRPPESRPGSGFPGKWAVLGSNQ